MTKTEENKKAIKWLKEKGHTPHYANSNVTADREHGEKSYRVCRGGQIIKSGLTFDRAVAMYLNFVA